MKCLDEHLEHFAGGQQKKDINTTRLLIKFEEKKKGLAVNFHKYDSYNYTKYTSIKG